MPSIINGKLIPIVKLEKAADCTYLCEALLKGGIDVIEITFRTEVAAESIRLAVEKFPEMVVGAGTVITENQIKEAKEAGASFLVAPGLNPTQIKMAQKKDIMMIPGIFTPSEVEQAMSLGLEILKFFPAAGAGGMDMLRAFKDVYPVKFIPTGGISLSNIREFLVLPNVVACGGSWITPAQLINERDWKGVTHLVQEALKKMEGV